MPLKVLIAGMSQSGGGGGGSGIGGTTGTTDNAITRADGTGGSTLQGSLATIDDNGSLGTPGDIATGEFLYFGGTFASASALRFQNNGGGVGALRIGDNSAAGSLEISTLRLGSGNAILLADAANTLALRNSTNGQTWIVSRTFTDTSNFSQFKTIATGSVVAFTISELGTGVGTLTGYTFDKAVTAPNIPVVDTGWTANADNGSKAAVIPAAATLATIQTAMNLAVAGSGDALAATAAKVKALEAALVALLLPNA